MTRTSLVGILAVLSWAWPAVAGAQDIEQVVTLPPNLLLGNYDNVPVGPYGGLEGSAYSARVGDPSAAWFNPAGLSRQSTAQISGSAGVYQFISVSPESLPGSGGSLEQLPNFVGFTFNIGHGLTAGAALLTTMSWAQQTDIELIAGGSSDPERLAFSADSEFSRREAAFGVGYNGGSAWRIGGGLAFSMMDLRLVQSISDRLADARGLSTLLVAARASGNAVQLRTQGGVQYDTKNLRFGAAVRTPGLTLLDGGTLTFDGTLNSGGSSLGASLFDADPRLEYRLPWEFQAGGAYVNDRVELEVDVQAYSAIDAYPLLSTPNSTLIYRGVAGAVPTVTARPFDGLISESDAVANVAVGGHFRVVRGRDFRVHGGFSTGQSPTGAAEELFNTADLLSWTVGLSGTLAKFQFSAGFNRKTGTTRDVVVRNLLDGKSVDTTIDVKATGFIYSIAYQF